MGTSFPRGFEERKRWKEGKFIKKIELYKEICAIIGKSIRHDTGCTGKLLRNSSCVGLYRGYVFLVLVQAGRLYFFVLLPVIQREVPYQATYLA